MEKQIIDRCNVVSKVLGLPDMLQELLNLPAYQASIPQRADLLESGLCELSKHHYQHCAPYRNIIDGYWGGEDALIQTHLLMFPIYRFLFLKIYAFPRFSKPMKR